MSEAAYDFICSLGELIDKLSIENVKCYDANNKIIRERMKADPNAHRISRLERQARMAGEQRVRLRDEINRRINQAIRRGGVGCAEDVRTYEMGGEDDA